MFLSIVDELSGFHIACSIFIYVNTINLPPFRCRNCFSSNRIILENVMVYGSSS